MHRFSPRQPRSPFAFARSRRLQSCSSCFFDCIARSPRRRLGIWRNRVVDRPCRKKITIASIATATFRIAQGSPRYGPKSFRGRYSMFTIYNCVAYQHDLRLVVLAALVCALASFAAINFLNHVRKTTGYMRDVWLCVAAAASGFGIWATHFIAMLAYSPGIPSGYNIILTILSLFAAILLTGAGLLIASGNRLPARRWIGGATVGGGIAAMHYTGMAAFEIAGRLQWNPVLVVASIALGAAIGAAALPAGLRDGSMKWKVIGAALLTLAICSHHFTAMGAVSIIPDPTVVVSEMALPAGWLALGVALASLTILFLACAG